MKFFVLIFAIWTWQVCSSKPVTENDSTQQIKSGDYPYHVLLRLSYSRKFPLCEGVLIHKDFALTSAACLQKYKQDPDSIEVAVGATSVDKLDTDQNVQIRSISKIIINKQWFTSKGESGDIALVKVSESFKLNSFVNLAKLGEDVKPKEDHILVTYGEGEDLRTKPKQIDSKESCANKTNSNVNDGNNSTSTIKGEFCDTSEYDSSPDNNFVGAPLVKTDNLTVVGISSSKSSTLYTSVPYYQDWIESITNPGKARTKATSTAAPTTISSFNSTNSNGSTTSYQTTRSHESTTASYTKSYVNGTTAAATTVAESSEEETTDIDDYDSDETTTSLPTTTEEEDETTEESDESEEATTSLPTTTEEQDETTEESDESEEATTSLPTTTEEQDETTEESDESEESTTQLPTTTEEEDETTEESDESEESTTQIPTTTEEDDETTEESEESEETSTKPYSTSSGSSIPSSSRTTAHVGTSTPVGTTSSSNPTSGSTARPGSTTSSSSSTSKPSSTTPGDDDDDDYHDYEYDTRTTTSTATTSKTTQSDNSDSSDDSDDDYDIAINGAPNQPNDSEANSQKKSELLQDEPVSRNSAKQSLPLSFISSWMSKRNGIFDSMKKLKSFLTI